MDIPCLKAMTAKILPFHPKPDEHEMLVREYERRYAEYLKICRKQDAIPEDNKLILKSTLIFWTFILSFGLICFYLGG